MSAPRRDDATRPALPDDRRARAESRRWAEVRRAVREAEAMGLYAVEVRGVKATLRFQSGRQQQCAQVSKPAHAELSTRQEKEKARSRARKDAFHAKKREEAAAAAVPSSLADEHHPQQKPADDDMRPVGKRAR